MKFSLELLQSHIGKTGLETPSGAGNWMQLTLVDIQSGEAQLKMRIRPEMCNPYGMIHGGMMSLLIDESIGWAIASLETEQSYTSLNLMVDFLYAAPIGAEITAHSKIIRHGKKIINAEVKVYNEDQVLLSKATSNLIITSLPRINPDAQK